MCAAIVRFAQLTFCHACADQEAPNSRSPFAGVLGLLLVPALAVYIVLGLEPVHRPFSVCCVCAKIWDDYTSQAFMPERDFRQVCASVAKFGFKPEQFKQLQVTTFQYGCLNVAYGQKCPIACQNDAARPPLSASSLNPWSVWAIWRPGSYYSPPFAFNISMIQMQQSMKDSFGTLGAQACNGEPFICAATDASNPYKVCDLPDSSSILAIIGAGFGLVMGFFVNAPAGVRVLWRRTPVSQKRIGTLRDFLLGFAQVFCGLLYFGLVYVFLNNRSTRYQRAGAMVGASIVIICLHQPVTELLFYLRFVSLATAPNYSTSNAGAVQFSCICMYVCM